MGEMELTDFLLWVDFQIMSIGEYLALEQPAAFKDCELNLSDFLFWIWIPAAFLYGSLWMATRRKRLWLNFLGGYGGVGETLNLLDPGKAFKTTLIRWYRR